VLSLFRNIDNDVVDLLFEDEGEELILRPASELWDLTKPKLVRETDDKSFYEPKKFTEIEIDLVIAFYNSCFAFEGSLKENIFNGDFKNIMMTYFCNTVPRYSQRMRRIIDPTEVSNYMRSVFRQHAHEDVFQFTTNPNVLNAERVFSSEEEQARASEAMSTLLQKISVLRTYCIAKPSVLRKAIFEKSLVDSIAGLTS
jgi:virulence-associated protein VagC